MPTKNFTDAKKILNCHICWLLSSLWCLYLVLERHLDVLWDWIEFCWRWFWVLRCVQYPTKWPSRHFASLKRNQNQLFSAAEACQSTDQDRHKSSRCLQWRLSTPHCQPHHQPHRQPHHQPHRQPRRQRCRQPRRQPRDCEVRTIMLFSIVIQISWVFILTSSTLWLAWMKSKNCWGTRKDNNLIFCFCSAEDLFPIYEKIRLPIFTTLSPGSQAVCCFCPNIPAQPRFTTNGEEAFFGSRFMVHTLAWEEGFPREKHQQGGENAQYVIKHYSNTIFSFEPRFFLFFSSCKGKVIVGTNQRK